MRVNDDDSDDDGGDDKHHCEEHVFPYERNSAGGGRDQLHNNEQEDSQGQQDRDGQGHLFTWTGGHKDSGYIYTILNLNVAYFFTLLCLEETGGQIIQT